MVKRYEPHLKEVRGEDPTATMLEWSNGDWIEFGHYEALAAELAGCKQQLAIAPTITKMMEGDNARIAQLEAALRYIGKACALSDDETDMGIVYRACFPLETPAKPLRRAHSKSEQRRFEHQGVAHEPYRETPAEALDPMQHEQSR